METPTVKYEGLFALESISIWELEHPTYNERVIYTKLNEIVDKLNILIELKNAEVNR